MKKWVFTFLALLLMSSQTVAAEKQPEPMLVTFGTGNTSCANWLSSPQKEQQGRAWILGFWSGINLGRIWNSDVGHDTDAEAIFAEVKKICNDAPSKKLLDATFQFYAQSAGKQGQKICNYCSALSCPKN